MASPNKSACVETKKKLVVPSAASQSRLNDSLSSLLDSMQSFSRKGASTGEAKSSKSVQIFDPTKNKGKADQLKSSNDVAKLSTGTQSD